MSKRNIVISDHYSKSADAVIFRGDARDLLKDIPRGSVQLIVTSPPYNIGKEYEEKKDIERYLQEQADIIGTCATLLAENGSICWQIGNHVSTNSEIFPLDILLYQFFKNAGLVLRNRIIWHFGHGLHTQRRFSGRYESILWFTRATTDYTFNLDQVRVQQKYPGKRAFRGPRHGQYSSNPLGKNPSDFWDRSDDALAEVVWDSNLPDFSQTVWSIPNVKSNHVEKTDHPCQFPIGLVQRLIKALTNEADWVLDPFLGSGTTACAAILEGRKALGSELKSEYCKIAVSRVKKAWRGALPIRPFDKPIYVPTPGSKLTKRED